jgi:hypothetical protein
MEYTALDQLVCKQRTIVVFIELKTKNDAKGY